VLHGERQRQCGAKCQDDKRCQTYGEIAYIYLQANQFDVDEAKLGIVRGTASAVKQHGEMVAKDHGSVIAGLARLADHFHSALRITCPAGTSLS
jgi:predicted outer membrane protein